MQSVIFHNRLSAPLIPTRYVLLVVCLQLHGPLVHLLGRLGGDLVGAEVANLPNLLGRLEAQEQNNRIDLQALQPLHSGNGYIQDTVTSILQESRGKIIL